MRVSKMQRHFDGTKSVYPKWIARVCCRCGDMVKYENMWCSAYWVFGCRAATYFCLTCCPTKEDVYNLNLDVQIEKFKEMVKDDEEDAS